jgi:hypothetical protein
MWFERLRKQESGLMKVILVPDEQAAGAAFSTT